MSDKPLDNLSRDELIALVQSLQQQLADRPLAKEDPEAIARAVSQYREGARAMQARQEAEYHRRLAEQQAQALLLETRETCRALLISAQQGADYYWAELQKKVQQFLSQPELQQQFRTTAAAEDAELCFGPDD